MRLPLIRCRPGILRKSNSVREAGTQAQSLGNAAMKLGSQRTELLAKLRGLKLKHKPGDDNPDFMRSYS